MNDLVRFPSPLEWRQWLAMAASQGLTPQQLPMGELHPDAPLVAYPLKIDWQMTLPAVETEPYPAPVVTSHDPQPAEMLTPKPFALLNQFACEQLWSTLLQYSQGCEPHSSTGKPGALKDVLALRFGGHPTSSRQAYATYMRTASGGAWTWASVMIWGPDLPPFMGCGVTELKEFLADPQRPAAWVNEIRARRASQAAQAKARARSAPKRNTSGEAS